MAPHGVNAKGSKKSSAAALLEAALTAEGSSTAAATDGGAATTVAPAAWKRTTVWSKLLQAAGKKESLGDGGPAGQNPASPVASANVQSLSLLLGSTSAAAPFVSPAIRPLNLAGVRTTYASASVAQPKVVGQMPTGSIGSIGTQAPVAAAAPAMSLPEFSPVAAGPKATSAVAPAGNAVPVAVPIAAPAAARPVAVRPQQTILQPTEVLPAVAATIKAESDAPSAAIGDAAPRLQMPGAAGPVTVQTPVAAESVKAATSVVAKPTIAQAAVAVQPMVDAATVAVQPTTAQAPVRVATQSTVAQTPVAVQPAMASATVPVELTMAQTPAATEPVKTATSVVAQPALTQAPVAVQPAKAQAPVAAPSPTVQSPAVAQPAMSQAPAAVQLAIAQAPVEAQPTIIPDPVVPQPTGAPATVAAEPATAARALAAAQAMTAPAPVVAQATIATIPATVRPTLTQAPAAVQPALAPIMVQAPAAAQTASPLNIADSSPIKAAGQATALPEPVTQVVATQASAAQVKNDPAPIAVAAPAQGSQQADASPRKGAPTDRAAGAMPVEQAPAMVATASDFVQYRTAMQQAVAGAVQQVKAAVKAEPSTAAMSDSTQAAGLLQALSQGRPLSEAAAAPAAPLDSSAAATATSQIADAVISAPHGASNELHVRLNPPDLGAVHISLKADGSAVRATLEVDNPRTLAEIRAEAPALTHRLAESGIQVKSLDFVLASGGSDSAGQWNLQDRQWGHQQQGPFYQDAAPDRQIAPRQAFGVAYSPAVISDQSINICV